MGKCNEAETAAKVKEFFENEFWHLINQGGIHPNQLSSPQIDGMPANHSNINGVEKSLVGQIGKAEHARNKAIIVLTALDEMTDFENSKHQTLLRDVYIKKLSKTQVEVIVNFSDYQLRKELRAASVEFAEKLNFWKEYRNINDLPDLVC